MSYESRILSLSPLLYLPFTETSGSTFTDLTGNGHTGTIVGVATAGATDGPIHLEKACSTGPGSGTQISIAGASTLPNGGPSWSYEAWSKTFVTNNIASWALVLGSPNGFFLIDVSQQDALAFIVDGTNGDERAFGNNHSDNLTCWHYWCVTWDGVSISLYRDGISATYFTDFNSNPTWTPSSAPTTCHINSDTPTNNGIFYINHLAIYNFALTSSDVAANYAAASPRQDGPCFGLPAYRSPTSKIYIPQL